MEKLEINIIKIHGEVQDDYAMRRDKQKAYTIFVGSIAIGILLTFLQYIA